MNDVLIIGFGLLGSSLAYSLKANGYHVFAYDKDESSLAFGKENNLIDGICSKCATGENKPCAKCGDYFKADKLSSDSL